MSLVMKDHLTVLKDRQPVDPDKEGYQEFEVMGSLHSGEVANHVTAIGGIDVNGNPYEYYDVRIRVVK